MTHDRITSLRVAGLRSLADVQLDLSGLTVLIGDNGSGKSSILEALELLRLAANPRVRHAHDVVARHGGLPGLLRRGEAELRIGVTIRGAEGPLDYDFSFVAGGAYVQVASERISIGGNTLVDRVQTALRDAGGREVHVGDEGVLGLSLMAMTSTAREPAARVARALMGIDAHYPFEVRPLWQQLELNSPQGARQPSSVEQSPRLGRYGLNLANAFQAIQNRGPDFVRRVIAQVGLGLGEDVERFEVQPVGRGSQELRVQFGRLGQPIPVDALSEGQLAYLCFVALCNLTEGRSLLSVDEPELHLHPGLLTRVAWMLESAAEATPVIVATHSDRFLDALKEPAASVVLCSLDESRATLLQRPNPERLADWLETYRGIGALRAEGLEPHVFDGGPSAAQGGNVT